MWVRVPEAGPGLLVQVSSALGLITSLGPFREGAFLARVSVRVFLLTQTGPTGLRLGFALGSGQGRVAADFERGTQLLVHPPGVGVDVQHFRLQLPTGGQWAFDFYPGQRFGTGSTWLLVYHDLEDGTDPYDLAVCPWVERIAWMGDRGAVVGDGG